MVSFSMKAKSQIDEKSQITVTGKIIILNWI